MRGPQKPSDGCKDVPLLFRGLESLRPPLAFLEALRRYFPSPLPRSYLTGLQFAVKA